MPTAHVAITTDSALGYLLLGDLRAVLEQPPHAETQRWLLALLDRLLAGWERAAVHRDPSLLSPSDGWHDPVEVLIPARAGLFGKLQRLRDRIAHRAPYALLANEIRCDLDDWFGSHLARP